MNPDEELTPSPRDAALRGLAVVGFLALIGLGVWLAIYSARYVPNAVNGLTAAVGLTSVFHPSTSTVSVVPSGMGTDGGNASYIPIATTTATLTPTATTSTIGAPKTSTSAPAKPAPGQETSATYPIGAGATTTGSGSATLYGLSDLATTITAVGYLATSSTDSFIAASTSPLGTRPAIKFTIKNVGTNVMPSGWGFSVYLPTGSSYLFQSAPQQALNPGDYIDYTLGFDQANVGNDTITVNANWQNIISEETRANNQASASIIVQGP